MVEKLKITEIFYSIQGEGSFAGFPCAFIRLTGCPLRCSWCDTKYSFGGGDDISIKSILDTVEEFNTEMVEITGGEPLDQDGVYNLMRALHAKKKKVLLETSGAISIEKVPDYVHIVMDLKAPASGEEAKNMYSNLDHLKESDDLKVVVEDIDDFHWLEKQLDSRPGLSSRVITVQPSFDKLEYETLAEWIKNSGRNFKLGIQLHKHIYDPEARAT